MTQSRKKAGLLFQSNKELEAKEMSKQYDGWEWVGVGIFALCLCLGIGGCKYLTAKAEAIKADTKAKLTTTLIITNSFNSLEHATTNR